MTETTYTLFVNTDHVKEIEELDEYLVLTQKPCMYANGKYSVIVFTILDQTPECYDPETILEVMGGLVLHEDGSNCFLMLENDIGEVADIFCWDGAANILMSEMLTADDKRVLLEKKKEKEGYEGDILINLGTRQEPQWTGLNCRSNAMFDDTSTIYQLGAKGPVTDIWWPFLIEENGGFNFVIQNTFAEEPKAEQLQYPLTKLHPNPWDPEDDDFFNDYDDCNWMHMHHGGRYQF